MKSKLKIVNFDDCVISFYLLLPQNYYGSNAPRATNLILFFIVLEVLCLIMLYKNGINKVD